MLASGQFNKGDIGTCGTGRCDEIPAHLHRNLLILRAVNDYCACSYRYQHPWIRRRVPVRDVRRAAAEQRRHRARVQIPPVRLAQVGHRGQGEHPAHRRRGGGRHVQRQVAAGGVPEQDRRGPGSPGRAAPRRPAPAARPPRSARRSACPASRLRAARSAGIPAAPPGSRRRRERRPAGRCAAGRTRPARNRRAPRRPAAGPGRSPPGGAGRPPDPGGRRTRTVRSGSGAGRVSTARGSTGMARR